MEGLHLVLAAIAFCSDVESAAPTAFRMIDVNGDGRLDRLEVGAEGSLRVELNRGGRQFEAVVQQLPDVIVTDALAADLNGDGHTDLYLVSGRTNVALVGDGTGRFVDGTFELGLVDEGRGIGIEHLDIDADGTLDILLHNAGGDALFWGTPEGAFERDSATPPTVAAVTPPARGVLPSEKAAAAQVQPKTATSQRVPVDVSVSGVTWTPSASGSGGGSAGLASAPVSPPGILPVVTTPGCIGEINDFATGACVRVSSLPTLGMLYPLSQELNIDPLGYVGLGTTTPGARLHVAGTALIADTLTLDPPDDQALDIASGSLYKNGSLFMHTRGGPNSTALGEEAMPNPEPTSRNNTATGFRALFSVASGGRNTATGSEALLSNTGGTGNVASGWRTLFSNTGGIWNTAVGTRSLYYNTFGGGNTATGYLALFQNTTGTDNTATGIEALASNDTGDRNTAFGSLALVSNSTGSNNTAVGRDAMAASSTGSNNTAVGRGALGGFNTGDSNTALGVRALESNTSGTRNSAAGWQTLQSNTTGSNNAASGSRALRSNTTGFGSSAMGTEALLANTTGFANTASGFGALIVNTSGFYNTAVGYRALDSNTTGDRNIAIGRLAGENLSTGNDNIAIGNLGVFGEGNTIRLGTPISQNRTFIAGIRGVTTGNANAIPVLIDNNGQLGTVSSSRRFKEEIEDMGKASESVLDLRPVVFKYKQHLETYGDDAPLEYGLIAEEVAEVFPDLVVYDEDGEILTVKYHLLSSLLLNELQRHERELEDLRARLEALEQR